MVDQLIVATSAVTVTSEPVLLVSSSTVSMETTKLVPVVDPRAVVGSNVISSPAS